MAEHNLPKIGAVGSTPIYRTPPTEDGERLYASSTETPAQGVVVEAWRLRQCQPL